MDKWNLEVKSEFGDEYFIDWFETDGSISIFYSPLWDQDEIIDNFTGSWAWTKGISADIAMTEEHLKEYISDVENMIRREFLLQK